MSWTRRRSSTDKKRRQSVALPPFLAHLPPLWYTESNPYEKECIDMSVNAILFDLDGTLLPMDQQRFTEGYFRELAAVLAPYGIEPKALIAAVWAGTKAMVKNDGSKQNDAVFWERFRADTGLDTETCRPLTDAFYSNEFHRARRFTRENPLAAEAVRAARGRGRKVILATNPLFPMVGQASRLSWLGLKPEDFDLVTSYESDRFCKPNPAYFTEICRRMDLDPAGCLMIGNDETEDMWAATAAGLQAYLVTDCLIPSQDHPWQGPRGTFAQMVEMLKAL